MLHLYTPPTYIDYVSDFFKVLSILIMTTRARIIAVKDINAMIPSNPLLVKTPSIMPINLLMYSSFMLLSPSGLWNNFCALRKK